MRLKDTGLTAAELKAQVKKYMIETYERMDFVADYAEGIYMYDENGEAYLDFYAGIAVNCLGNCNPKVVKAVQEQSALIMQTFNYPYTIPQAVLSMLRARPAPSCSSLFRARAACSPQLTSSSRASVSSATRRAS